MTAFREGFTEPVSTLSHLAMSLLIEVRDDVSLDQSATVEMMRRGQIQACFEGRANGIYNGSSTEHSMESKVIGSQGFGLSPWKDELVIDLDREDHRGAGWEEVEEPREFGKRGPCWRCKLGCYQCIDVI